MNDGMRKLAQFFIVALLLVSQSVIAKQEHVEYSIEITNPVQHLAKVTATFPAIESATLDISLPAWRTGKYKILNLAAGIGKVQAFGDHHQSLRVNKINKSTWRVAVDKPQTITFEYELYADQLGSRTRHIDESHAFIDSASVLVYTDVFRASPASITLKTPKGWVSRSGLEKIGKHRFLAPNYDVLVDSPIETGVHAYYTFEVDHKTHELVIWGSGNQNDAQIVQDLQKISVAAGTLWGVYPFGHYVWMLHLTSGVRGATEHINSTIIQTDRFKFSPRKDYLDFLSTAAHEFIHTWNVKAYRPQGIYPYDYQQENYSSLLWLAEGSTSYFSPLLLVRSGVIDGKEFLGLWAKAVDQHLNRPGREQQSPAEASFDAWLDESSHWDHNAKADIYTQGMMVSWLLDMQILENTALQKGYEQVHRLLYERFPLAKSGYDEEDVLTLLQEVSGQDMTGIWRNYIQGTQQADINTLLLKLGLRMQYGDVKNDNDNDNVKSKDPITLWTGIHLTDSGEDARIQRVQHDSPAWQAGLTSEDVIVAINDYRVNRESFSKKLNHYRPGNQLTVHYFRQDRLQSALLRLIDRSAEALKLIPVDQASEQQQAFFKAWSGLEWLSLKGEK